MITPKKNCNLCVRLKKYRDKYKILEPDWHNAPVESFGKIDAKILIVGLAPGLKGANKTGRPFTGDHAGKLLYTTLIKFKLATGVYKGIFNDKLKLHNTRITNSVRCVPPKNKPDIIEKNNCRKFLESEIKNMHNLKLILALGSIAHQEILKSFKIKLSLYKFKHGDIHNINNNILLYDSYHCSRYNTQTRRLTKEMFEEVISSISHNI
jgi:uracil-DNA glycosylase family 4